MEVHRRWASTSELPGESPSLARLFHGFILANITANGVYPHHLLWRRGGGQVRHERLRAHPTWLVEIACEVVQNRIADALIFGFDVKNDADLGLPCADGIMIGEWRDGGWRVGVIAYRCNPIVALPIDWNNQVAIGRIQTMVLRAAERLKTKQIILPFSAN